MTRVPITVAMVYRAARVKGLVPADARALLASIRKLQADQRSGKRPAGRRACGSCGGGQTVGDRICESCGGTGRA